MCQSLRHSRYQVRSCNYKRNRSKMRTNRRRTPSVATLLQDDSDHPQAFGRVKDGYVMRASILFQSELSANRRMSPPCDANVLFFPQKLGVDTRLERQRVREKAYRQIVRSCQGRSTRRMK